MEERGASVALRPMTAADVPDVVAVQERGAVRALGAVFPQAAYPFPREDVAERWRREVAAPDVDCFVVLVHEMVQGFAATRGDELLHFGIAVELWGTGVAERAHDAVLDPVGGPGCGPRLADGLHRQRPRPCVLREAGVAGDRHPGAQLVPATPGAHPLRASPSRPTPAAAPGLELRASRGP